MKRYLTYFCLLALYNCINGQADQPYQEKTGAISTRFADSISVMELSVYKPFVEFRNSADDRGNAYTNKTAHFRQDSLKDSIAGFLHRMLLKKLKRAVGKTVESPSIKVKTFALSSADLAVVERKITKLKETLKTTEVKAAVFIDDTLYEILKRYPDDQQIFHQIFLTATFYPMPDLKAANSWAALYSFFVIDLRNRQLLFYNYQQMVAQSVPAYFQYKSQKKFIKITKAYKDYLWKNHRYQEGYGLGCKGCVPKL